MSENILIDGDFDQQSFAWRFSSRTQVEITDLSGNAFCVIAATASILQDVTLIPGTQYQVRLKSKGTTSGTVEIINATTLEIYESQPFNSETNVEWHNESLYFVAGDWAGPLNIRFSAAWSEQEKTTISIDNLVLAYPEMVYNTPYYVTYTSSYHFGFKNRDNVPEQHNRLYVNGIFNCEFKNTNANALTATNDQFSNPDDVFNLVAIDDYAEKQYELYRGTLGDLIAAGNTIYLE